MFAVQNGGWCAVTKTAGNTFDKYGKSDACNNDGKSGGWANNVYEPNCCLQALLELNSSGD